MKRFSVVILLAIFIASLGCSSKTTDKNEAKIPVRTSTINLGNIVKSVTYNGDIKAEVEVKVFSKIPNRIEKMIVEVGDRVSKGQPIAEIYAPTIKDGLEQVKAGLVAARAQEQNSRVEFERAERLFKENAMSAQQYDGVKTQYEAAKAQLQQAESMFNTASENLSDAIVEAPISGIIGERYFETGDMANMAQPLVTVVQMDRVKIMFNATEEDLGQISLGQRAEVSVKTYSDTVFTGKVTKISPVLDPLTRMASVEVLINNPDKKLKPGMFATIKVITGNLEDVIVVPRYATIENTTLVRETGNDLVIKDFFVFVAKDSIAEQRKLDVKYATEKELAINSGLQIGEELVVEGVNNLRDKSPIVIVKEGGEI